MNLIKKSCIPYARKKIGFSNSFILIANLILGLMFAISLSWSPIHAETGPPSVDSSSTSQDLPTITIAPPELAPPLAELKTEAQTALKPYLLASQVPLALDKADNSYLIMSTALVLMMTLPGLALFYGGMVRKKNIVSTVTQSVAVTCLVAVLWFLIGYSLAFGVNTTSFASYGADVINGYIGGFDTALLNGVTPQTAYKATASVPEMTWVSYQMTFAIITPALIAGALAERVKFSGLMLFMGLWSLLVYAPICHMVWGGGIMAQWGVLDFAGGSVVHVNAGVAGLVAALWLGRRRGYGSEPMNPNNVIFVMIGAAMLLVGWIGFNAGSQWAADGVASAALINTLLAALTAGLSWKLVEWIFRSKPSLLGVLSGIVAGLVAITPACGFVEPKGAMIIGGVAGPLCYFSSVWLKKILGYDDSLDAFGIHGVGGAIGALLTGYFASEAINPLAKDASVVTQAMGLGLTVAWSVAGTLIILLICQFTTGLRVSAADEDQGLDRALHDEALEN
jgi:Amt family ammonium transporter